MTTKRIFGFIFIVLAIILSLAIVGQLPLLVKAITGFFKIFTGTLDANQIGYFIGAMIYWAFHVSATIALWIYGLKWIKRKKDINQL